jgi:peptide-methionine (S)-S-oxide reductase
VQNPTYKQVCSNETGHAEVIQITYDGELISYKELLEVFFSIHDPTTLNRQGGDMGTQYRSAVFYETAEQKADAEEVMTSMAELWDDPIVTELTELSIFYPAEDYHHDYYASNSQQGYCQMVIAPKVVKFRKQFQAKLKSQ